MKRILALDVGDKRIGIAVSDPLGYTAQGLMTNNRRGDPVEDAAYIRDIAKRYAPVKLLFGMPRNMDGSYGGAAEKVKNFSALVMEGFDAECDFYDERLTTVTAEKVLYDARMDWIMRRRVVDKLAAVVILQGYLDSGKAN